MSTVKTKNVQIGADGTASNNFTIYQPSTPDGTSRWAVGVSGATTADVITVNSSGNVGIGTASPSYKLSIANSASTGNIAYFATATGVPIYIASYGSTGGIFSEPASNNGWGLNASSNYITAFTNGLERMRIDSNGNAYIAKTTTSDTTKGIQLQASGRITSTMTESANGTDNLTVYSTGASAYRFYVGMGGTIYATSTTITGISDVRLKENIRDLDDGLDTILSLKPRKFDWKEGKGKDIKNDRGFIAQEFEQILPDLIDEWKDPAPEGEEPYKSVRADLIPTLVKAIQEQQTIIESLKTDIAELKAKVN